MREERCGNADEDGRLYEVYMINYTQVFDMVQPFPLNLSFFSTLLLSISLAHVVQLSCSRFTVSL